MGILGFETRGKEQPNVVIQASSDGSSFEGLARTNDTTLTDTSTLIQQERYNYQRTLSGESTGPQNCMDLTGRKLYIADVLISFISVELSAYLGDFNFGNGNDGGEFDAVFDFPYAVPAGSSAMINHHFDPPLLFQAKAIGIFGAVDEKWFTVKRDNANVAINFCISGWVEK
jgi:hypothetical protein